MKAAKYHIKKQKEDGKLKQTLWVDESESPLEDVLPQDLTDQVASLLDGQPRAVERSSGGQILVKPIELFIKESPEGEKQIRVKVLFRELETDSTGKVISKICVTSSKTVLLSEIKKGTPFSKDQAHNCVVDFGLGLIPIRVISFREDEKLRKWAIFVRHDELESALLSEGSSQAILTLYEIPVDLMRWVEPISEQGKKDFSWARKHVKQLVERGLVIVPEVLRLTQVSVYSGITLSEMDELLKKSVSGTEDVQEKSSHIISSIGDDSGSNLLPLNENTFSTKR